MTRLFAIGGYVYQSGAAIVLIFAISHILMAGAYTTFSLVLASSQLLCVLSFEWLQLAGLRFLAGARANEAAQLRWSLFGAGILSAAALVVAGGCVSLLSDLSRTAVLLGLTVAVLQGITDLYFLAIRLTDRLGTAAFLLMLRATALLAGAIVGAINAGTAEATLAGLALGHATGLIIAIIAHRTPLRPASFKLMLTDWQAFCRYGMLAAGASVIHLSVPLLLRVIVIGRLGTTGGGAGFSIALDLLQRPFWVLNAAIHTVSYPEVVSDFETGSDAKAIQSTGKMFEFMICATIVMLGGLIAFLPEAAQLLVPRESLEGFMAVAPHVAVFYFMQTHLQATLAVVPHLEKRAGWLVLVAALQLVAVAASSAIAVAAGQSPRATITWAATATAIVILLALGPTIRFKAKPRLSLANEALLAALLIGSLATLPMQPVIWLAGKILLAAALTAIVAWRGNFLIPPRPRDQAR